MVDFYAIGNGETPASSSKENEKYSFVLSNMLQLGLDGATMTNQTNYQSAAPATAKTNNTKATFSTTHANLFIGGNLLDDFEDDSIDTNIWDVNESASGSITESGGQLILLSGGSEETSDIEASQVNAFDAKAATDDSAFFFDARLDTVSTDSRCVIYITDGSNEVLLYDTVGADTTLNGLWIITIDKGAETASLTRDGNAIATDTDISTPNNWYLGLRVRSSVGGNDGTITVNFVTYFKDSSNKSVTVTFGDTAVTPTVAYAILVARDTPASGETTTYKLAADSSNFESVTLDQIHSFSNTGTTMNVQVVLGSTATTPSTFTSYAFYYSPAP